MAKDKTFDLFRLLKVNPDISLKQQISYVWKLSLPGIFAQISSILMQYIDAAMVGNLGANASAAIGLVASSTWVLGSLSNALCIGFTVQVAHSFGAGDYRKAKYIFKKSINTCFIFSFLLLIFSSAISYFLPTWLGGASDIRSDAFWYFLIFGLSTPFFITVYLMSGMMQCSGNMKLPGILNGTMCLLDVAFNFLFINILHLGVKGAALGTASASLVTALIMFTYECFFSKLAFFTKKTVPLTGDSSLTEDNLYPEKSVPDKVKYKGSRIVFNAIKLALPIGLESSAFTGALVAVSRIIAPLGSAALAANSFATTAEALCYMPGYGFQEAATTLVGQSVGAKRKDLTKSFSIITILAGVLIQSLMGVIMYFLCPYVMAFLSPVQEIQMLGVKVLRIELFAEPFYAAAIVSTGCTRARGDTLVPSLLNLFSLWVVRISLSLILVKPYGLIGIWIAMTIELTFRGLIMLARLFIFPKKLPC